MFAMVCGGDGREGGYPFVLDSENARTCDFHGQVVGQVYEVDNDTLDRLDDLEEHPDVYRRRLTDVARHSKKAWIYVYEEPGDLKSIKKDTNGRIFDPVPELDWRKYYNAHFLQKKPISRRRIATVLVLTAVVVAGMLTIFDLSIRHLFLHQTSATTSRITASIRGK